MKDQILRVLSLIALFVAWYPPAAKLLAVLREMVERHWPEFLVLWNKTSASKRTAFSRAAAPAALVRAIK